MSACSSYPSTSGRGKRPSELCGGDTYQQEFTESSFRRDCYSGKVVYASIWISFFLFRERLFSLEGRKNLKAVSLYGFCSPPVHSLDLRKWSWRYTSLSALPKTCGTSGQEVVLCIHMEAVKSRPNE